MISQPGFKCIALIAAGLFLLGGCLHKSNDEKYHKDITEKFIAKYHLLENGGIRTNIRDIPANYEFAVGSDVLSESQGLFMTYAVIENDPSLFEKSFHFVNDKLVLNESISYRYSDEYGKFSVNAAIDDFRIIRALLEAAIKFDESSYQKAALNFANRLYRTNVADSALYDFYDSAYQEHNDFLTLCYGDLKTIAILSSEDGRWKPVFENVKQIIEQGYISDEFPFFATSYHYESNSYKLSDIETVQSLITAIHLAELYLCPKRTVEFIKRKVLAGELYGKYNITGEPLNEIESTAIYALASILGRLVKDDDLQKAALEQMKKFQIVAKNDPLYGGFANSETLEAFSFDNLYALLAFTERNQ